MLNGSPMGCGFFIFFNNLDTASGRGFQRVSIFEEPKEEEEALELIQILFSFLERR